MVLGTFFCHFMTGDSISKVEIDAVSPVAILSQFIVCKAGYYTQETCGIWQKYPKVSVIAAAFRKS